MFLRYGAIVLSLGLPLGLTACSSTSSEPSPAATQVSNELSRPGVALFRGVPVGPLIAAGIISLFIGKS